MESNQVLSNQQPQQQQQFNNSNNKSQLKNSSINNNSIQSSNYFYNNNNTNNNNRFYHNSKSATGYYSNYNNGSKYRFGAHKQQQQNEKFHDNGQEQTDLSAKVPPNENNLNNNATTTNKQTSLKFSPFGQKVSNKNSQDLSSSLLQNSSPKLSQNSNEIKFKSPQQQFRTTTESSEDSQTRNYSPRQNYHQKSSSSSSSVKNAPKIVNKPQITTTTSLLDWIENELDQRGIDSVIYGRHLLSVLKQYPPSDTATAALSQTSDSTDQTNDLDSGYGSITANTNHLKYFNNGPQKNIQTNSRLPQQFQRKYSPNKDNNKQRPTSTTKWMHKRYQQQHQNNNEDNDYLDRIYDDDDEEEEDFFLLFDSSKNNRNLTGKRNSNYPLTNTRRKDHSDYRKFMLMKCLKSALDKDSFYSNQQEIQPFIEELCNRYDQLELFQQQNSSPSGFGHHSFTNNSFYTSSKSGKPFFGKSGKFPSKFSNKSELFSTDHPDDQMSITSHLEHFIQKYSNSSKSNQRPSRAQINYQQTSPKKYPKYKNFGTNNQYNQSNRFNDSDYFEDDDEEEIGDDYFYNKDQQQEEEYEKDNGDVKNDIVQEVVPNLDNQSSMESSTKINNGSLTMASILDQAKKYYDAFPALGAGSTTSQQPTTTQAKLSSTSKTATTDSGLNSLSNAAPIAMSASTLSSFSGSSSKYSHQSSLDDSVFIDTNTVNPTNPSLPVKSLLSGSSSTSTLLNGLGNILTDANNTSGWNGQKIIKTIVQKNQSKLNLLSVGTPTSLENLDAVATAASAGTGSSSDYHPAKPTVMKLKSALLKSNRTGLTIVAPSSLNMDANCNVNDKTNSTIGMKELATLTTLKKVQPIVSTNNSNATNQQLEQKNSTPESPSTTTGVAPTSNNLSEHEIEKIYQIMPSFLTTKKKLPDSRTTTTTNNSASTTSNIRYSNLDSGKDSQKSLQLNCSNGNRINQNGAIQRKSNSSFWNGSQNCECKPSWKNSTSFPQKKPINSAYAQNQMAGPSAVDTMPLSYQNINNNNAAKCTSSSLNLNLTQNNILAEIKEQSSIMATKAQNNTESSNITSSNIDCCLNSLLPDFLKTTTTPFQSNKTVKNYSKSTSTLSMATATNRTTSTATVNENNNDDDDDDDDKELAPKQLTSTNKSFKNDCGKQPCNNNNKKINQNNIVDIEIINNNTKNDNNQNDGNKDVDQHLSSSRKISTTMVDNEIVLNDDDNKNTINSLTNPTKKIFINDQNDELDFPKLTLLDEEMSNSKLNIEDKIVESSTKSKIDHQPFHQSIDEWFSINYNTSGADDVTTDFGVTVDQVENSRHSILSCLLNGINEFDNPKNCENDETSKNKIQRNWKPLNVPLLVDNENSVADLKELEFELSLLSRNDETLISSDKELNTLVQSNRKRINQLTKMWYQNCTLGYMTDFWKMNSSSDQRNFESNGQRKTAGFACSPIVSDWGQWQTENNQTNTEECSNMNFQQMIKELSSILNLVDEKNGDQDHDQLMKTKNDLDEISSTISMSNDCVKSWSNFETPISDRDTMNVEEFINNVLNNSSDGDVGGELSLKIDDGSKIIEKNNFMLNQIFQQEIPSITTEELPPEVSTIGSFLNSIASATASSLITLKQQEKKMPLSDQHEDSIGTDSKENSELIPEQQQQQSMPFSKRYKLKLKSNNSAISNSPEDTNSQQFYDLKQEEDNVDGSYINGHIVTSNNDLSLYDHLRRNNNKLTNRNYLKPMHWSSATMLMTAGDSSNGSCEDIGGHATGLEEFEHEFQNYYYQNQDEHLDPSAYLTDDPYGDGSTALNFESYGNDLYNFDGYLINLRPKSSEFGSTTASKFLSSTTTTASGFMNKSSTTGSIYDGLDSNLKFKLENRSLVPDSDSKPVQKPCAFYLENACARVDCKFSHDISSIPCKYFLEGACYKDEFCPFLHERPKTDLERFMEGQGLVEDGQSLSSSSSTTRLDPNAKSFQFKIESDFDFPSLFDDNTQLPSSETMTNTSVLEQSNDRCNFILKTSGSQSKSGFQEISDNSTEMGSNLQKNHKRSSPTNNGQKLNINQLINQTAGSSLVPNFAQCFSYNSNQSSSSTNKTNKSLKKQSNEPEEEWPSLSGSSDSKPNASTDFKQPNKDQQQPQNRGKTAKSKPMKELPATTTSNRNSSAINFRDKVLMKTKQQQSIGGKKNQSANNQKSTNSTSAGTTQKTKIGNFSSLVF